MALPDFTTQDATAYKTAIDDTAQDHDSRIEQNEMDIADLGTAAYEDADAFSSRIASPTPGNLVQQTADGDLEDAGITVGDLVSQLPDDFYEEITKPLDGDFTAGEVSIVRMGNVVTITLRSLATFQSKNYVSTSAGFVPSNMLPERQASAVYHAGGSNIRLIQVQGATGALALNFMDWSGVSFYSTQEVGFNFSYVTNYGWPSS